MYIVLKHCNNRKKKKWGGNLEFFSYDAYEKFF